MNTERSEIPQLHWIKSTHSGGEGGDCVEIAPAPSAIHVRDSKDTGQGTLTVTPGAWTTFLDLARRS
ncbi:MULTISPECIES: DUF397 domain-containing protein [Streptomyces]|uniref:DUF397 domain-containing protein n=1 Tax=Streptomyces sudanensis TaxID=436397 RepID=A0ABY4TA90_9ACTN|nr:MULTISPECIES: DUF397 domain-containing protein [Streptomyces]MCP9957416.1 DUF397 domain-containing protein [Streptomyces sudanensis]MCP9986559.1 DUF397 domain-containing protein [Streptomyces sudanensis]MCQ0002036.1 DUF397 domain-containing protein [Streptomyces sudanensis]URN15118.1 DUF397 domain-containing protein [Streptomyces sudanensis]